ncbi:hypothetical protein [Polyangium mundeleinium]|uniref:HEAT repeat domain-containing protein n=1 Tax=Polyangium mundeleinium TaxID=2995306 RepID=A0ABT5EET2_9BACT|nr:hypothetical protein [Polyangium mundeleinium]MDC0739773.1 hypothetical protein [Polyangium mundeleinium]
MRKDETKVWHNPELAPFARAPKSGSTTRSGTTPQDSRVAKEHRAALEALFAPRREPEPEGSGKNGKNGRDSTPKPGRIVLAPPPQSDPRATERQRLLSKLLAVEGRPHITKAANEFLGAGFTFPDDQDVHLKLLEHSDESRVREALSSLSSLLVGELPKRRAVLESRLRRIEEFAEDESTRDAAAQLRRQVSGRPDTQNQSAQ